jgi:hypothetical protein
MPGIILTFVLGGLLVAAQSPKPPQTKEPPRNVKPAAASNPQQSKTASGKPQSPATSTLPPVQLDGSAVLHHLNQVISWYRHSTTGIKPVGLPTDAIYEQNSKDYGEQVVRLAFQSAKSETALIASQQQKNAAQPSGNATQAQNLSQIKDKTQSQIDQIESQVKALNAEIPKTRLSKRRALVAQKDALQSELDLQKELLAAIEKMQSFVVSNGEASGGLEGGVNQLAKSLPEVLGTALNNGKPVATPQPAKPTLANSGGLIGEAMTLYDFMSAMRQIDKIIRETDDTMNVANQLRTPLRNAMRSTIQESQRLANQPAVTDPQQIQAERQEFQDLTERFKQLSDALLPLSQETIVLNDAKTNLAEWRDSIGRESHYVLRSVLLRVLGIVFALVVILGLSEIWRRITFRYVHDARRRRQFLVMRRVVIGFLFVIVLILGFVSEFSSLATFAGFITAGIAVGLQAVLLSVAAYFFIIGRYGIRVGDRISVAGITGDVVDIGLVRLYLMELAGTGLDFYPTGRIVVFSNSVLFQTGTPLFKQIPGTEYSWHEVVVMVAPNGNHKMAEDKLVAQKSSGSIPMWSGASISRLPRLARKRGCNLPAMAWSCWCATRWKSGRLLTSTRR